MKKRFLLVPFVAIACVFTLILSGCGGANAEDLIREDLDSFLAEENVGEMMITNVDEQLGEDLSDFGVTNEEFTDGFLDGYAYEIGDIEVDGDSAMVEVTLTMKSATDVMNEWTTDIYNIDFNSVSGEEELYQMAGEMLMDALNNAEPITETGNVEYVKNADGDWEMEESSYDMLSSVFGG